MIFSSKKAFRLKQLIYDEIGKLLKSLKSPSTSEIDVKKSKRRLVILVALMNNLDETIEHSRTSAVDANLDLLNHKLNAVLQGGNVCANDFNQVDLDKRHDETALYLEDILLRCNSCNLPKMDSFKESKSQEVTKVMLHSHEFIMNFMHEIVWPEIFKRLDQKKKRKRLMVDLKNYTSEERQMVEEVGSECIDSILRNTDSFK